MTRRRSRPLDRRSAGWTYGPNQAAIESFLERARRMTDEDRRALADARRAVDDGYHSKAWRAANEAVLPRAAAYVAARHAMGASYLPDRLAAALAEGVTDRGELASWNEVARLAHDAMDDALLALLVSDVIPPDQLRELYGPWRAMVEAEKGRAGLGS